MINYSHQTTSPITVLLRHSKLIQLRLFGTLYWKRDLRCLNSCTSALEESSRAFLCLLSQLLLNWCNVLLRPAEQVYALFYIFRLVDAQLKQTSPNYLQQHSHTHKPIPELLVSCGALCFDFLLWCQTDPFKMLPDRRLLYNRISCFLWLLWLTVMSLTMIGRFIFTFSHNHRRAHVTLINETHAACPDIQCYYRINPILISEVSFNITEIFQVILWFLSNAAITSKTHFDFWLNLCSTN